MIFSKLLSSGNFGEPGIHTMVQSAVFRKVQGCNSVTKIGDISSMKYRLSTSYKYKIPRSHCNLYVFKDILSRYHYLLGMWVCVNCRVSKTLFCVKLPLPCHSRFPWMLVWRWRLLASFPHPEREPFRMSQAEVTRSDGDTLEERHWVRRGGVVLEERHWVPRCGVLGHSWRAEAGGTRCHCSSAAERPTVQFLGCECKVAVGGKGL